MKAERVEVEEEEETPWSSGGEKGRAKRAKTERFRKTARDWA